MDAKLKLNLKEYEFVDLGLPSGTLWAKGAVSGIWTASMATEAAGGFIPRKREFEELSSECKWSWDDQRKGYVVTGRDGKYIFLACGGYEDGGTVRGFGTYANYWIDEVAEEPYAYKAIFSRYKRAVETPFVRRNQRNAIILVKHGNGPFVAENPSLFDTQEEDGAGSKNGSVTTLASPAVLEDRPSTVPDNVRKAVKAVDHILDTKGESVSDMCKAAGVTVAEYRRWTKGGRMSDRSVVALAGYLGVQKALFTMYKTASADMPVAKGGMDDAGKEKEEGFRLPEPDILFELNHTGTRVVAWKKANPGGSARDCTAALKFFYEESVMPYWYVNPTVEELAVLNDHPVVRDMLAWRRMNPEEKTLHKCERELGVTEAVAWKYSCAATILHKMESAGTVLPVPGPSERIASWRREHPSGNKKGCAEDLGFSMAVVTLHWFASALPKDIEAYGNDPKLLAVANWMRANPDCPYPYSCCAASLGWRATEVARLFPLAKTIVGTSTPVPSENAGEDLPTAPANDGDDPGEGNGNEEKNDMNEMLLRMEQVAARMEAAAKTIASAGNDVRDRADIMSAGMKVIAEAVSGCSDGFKETAAGLASGLAGGFAALGERVDGIGAFISGLREMPSPVRRDDMVSINKYAVLSGLDSKSIHVILACKALGPGADEEAISRITKVRRREVSAILERFAGLL